MIGDSEDIRQRLRLTLPAHWFADIAPVLDSLLAGLSQVWSELYLLLQWVRIQTRVATADGDFLELAAGDFFGTRFIRRTSEPDDVFRGRLLWAMQRTRATRADVINAAAKDGVTITVFEPAQPADTGAYNVGGTLAWGVSGGWGSMQMPFECLITVQPAGRQVTNELWADLAQTMPAGGAAWLRIAS